MSAERWGETVLGAIVALVAIGFFVFAAAQAGQGGSRAGYDLVANFQRIDGVNVGTDVRVSGVKVGAVRAISLDPNTYNAHVVMSVDNGVHVLDQSTARVATDGLLGGAYIAIEPAGSDPLPAGGEIPNTQGSVDLLTLLASMARGPAGGAQNSSPAPASGTSP
jgi:phospholipid/cholesterol/gamma-HCH transport system substrate-binding protein